MAAKASKRKSPTRAAKKAPTPATMRRAAGAFPIERAMEYVRLRAVDFPNSTLSQVADATDRPSPFRVLIGTILSLRTQDRTTEGACRRLFALASTPATMLRLDEARIAEAIYPVGFYRTKARTILDIARALLEDHGGEVPDDIDALCRLRGVGRKTANLTVTLGFGSPGICVDTHVHRICNRWGYIRTKTPDATEARLRAKLPRAYWIPINEWLVLFGQNVCTPQSPHCSECGLADICRRVGVERTR